MRAEQIEELQKTVEVRPFRLSDYEFVFRTFLKGCYYGNPWLKEIDKDVFMDFYPKVITSILTRAAGSTWVACLKEDPDVIVGYAVFTMPNVLHFVYVKEAWRRLGIASFLVHPHKPTSCTHVTKIGLRLKPKSMIFNPFKL